MKFSTKKLKNSKTKLVKKIKIKIKQINDDGLNDLKLKSKFPIPANTILKLLENKSPARDSQASCHVTSVKGAYIYHVIFFAINETSGFTNYKYFQKPKFK